MKFLLTLFFAVAVCGSARCQDFRAFTSTMDLIEGGRVETLVVISGNEQYTVRCPVGWARQVDNLRRMITFTSPSGKAALFMQFTTNSPGTLPSADVLRSQALASHPGAGILQYSVCPTGYRPGVFFDLVRLASEGIMLKTRHAYIPAPNGEVEFILSANGDEFEKGRLVFMGTVNSFRVEPFKPKDS